MREQDNANGYFESASVRDEFFQLIDDEMPDLDPIHWARSMGYEVSPEANYRCGREIVEGQFAILRLTRISNELRLPDEQRQKIRDVLVGQRIGTLSDGFIGRVGNEQVSPRFADAHGRFMDKAALTSAEIDYEITRWKKMGYKGRGIVVDAVVRSEAERVLTAEAALNEITLRNMQLAKYVAIKYKGNSTLPILDLFQAANIGIMIAAARYDFNGVQFATYAHEWAMKEVKRAIAECDGAMTLPERARNELARNLRKIEERVQQLGRTLTDEELGEVLVGGKGKDITEREKRLGRKLTKNELDGVLMEARQKFIDSPKSSDVRFFSEEVHIESGDGEVELGDMIGSEEPEVDEIVGRFLVGSGVRMVISEVLTFKERTIADLRFGISDGRVRTLEEVGKEIGITGEGIRKAQIVAFEKFKRDGRLKQLYELV